jgi:hypothetical protein
MKKIYIAFLSLLFSALQFNSQTYVWAKQINGGTQAQSIKTDALGNVYVCGIFNSPTDFDPGVGVVTLANFGGVLYDSYVCKYTSAGILVWAKQIGGNGTDYCYELVLDASNNVYVAGRFDGTCDFDPGPGTANIPSNGNSDAYVVKLDVNGNYVWAKNMGGTALDEGHAICLDAAGNVLTSGMFAGTADFDPGPGTFTLATGAAYDPFVCKLDVNGNFLWAIQLAGTGADVGYGIMCDASNNVYSVGSFAATIDMDPGVGVFNIAGTGGFVSKLDANGTFVWGGAILLGSKVLTEIDIDPTGNLYLSGRFSNTPDFDPGAGTFTMTQLVGADDIFITKWDANMNFIWAKQMGGGGADYNYDMDVDAFGNVLATGYFSSTGGAADFDPGPAVYPLTALGTTDAYLAKLDANGNFLSANQIGTTNGDAAYCCHMDASGNLYAAGNYNGTVDFDPGPGTQNLTGTAGFMLKWFSCPAPPAQPGAISGLTSMCANNGATSYSIAPVGGATSYSWGFPVGWTGTSTTNIISASPGTSGTISVAASNGCSSGPTQTMLVTVNANPVITVNSGSICNGNSFTMIPGGASTYTYFPSGPVVSPVTNSSYSVTGTSTAGCVSTATAVSNVTVNNIPATPGAISGNITICSGSANTYSVAVVAGATSYLWTKPGGWTGVSTTNVINTTASSTSGNITVMAINACGSSAAQTLSVTVNTIPATPGAISGNISICPGSSNTYSVAAVAGATSYNWTKPGGWTGVSTTNVINTTASSTSGFVTVSASNACGTSAAQNLNVTVNPNPVITVNSGSICSGNSFTMVPGGASTYTYFPAGPIVSPLNNTTYSVMGTSSFGCVGSNTAISSVTVNNIPATPGAISGNTVICSGSANVYSVAPVAGATSYSWTKPGGWVGASSTNMIGTTASSTSGMVTVMAINACGSSAAQTLSVTVNTAPSTPGSISGNVNICSGSSNQYSVAAVVGATSYSWTKPGGWTGVSATNVINTTASSTSGMITVIAINTCGNSGAATLSVTVNTAPASPGAISGSVTLCSGSSDNYSVAPVSGATSYSWTLPAGWSGSSITNLINGTCGNSGNISVIASNVCGNSAAQTLSVTVITIPSSPVSISGPTSLCANVSAQYSTNPVSGATGYVWTLPVGWSGSSSTNSISATSGANSGNILVYASNSCGSSSPQTLSVTVNPAPSLTLAATPNNVCPGISTTLSASGASSYSWNTGAMTATTAVSPTATTIYTVMGTDLGCSSFSTITIGVFGNPTLNPTSSTTMLCLGQSATLTASGASTYTWFPSGSGSTIVVSPTLNTTYTVSGTNGNGCAASYVITQSVTICQGLSGVTLTKEDLLIYPNPFTDRITIGQKELPSIIEVYSVVGEHILSKVPSPLERAEGEASIDMRNFPNGIYFARIGTVTKKIIKE